MSDKWTYVFKNSIRDFVLMAMITISLVSILVVSNIGNENSAYLIRQQEKDKIKDDEDNKQAELSITNIKNRLDHLDDDIDKINHTTSQLNIIMKRILLFEEQIHNENLIKFQKLDKLQSDDEIKFNKLDNITSFMVEESSILEDKLDDILIQIQKNVDGTLLKIDKKITKVEEILNNSTK